MRVGIDVGNVWIQILKNGRVVLGFFTKTEQFVLTSFKIICFLAQAIVLYCTPEAG